MKKFNLEEAKAGKPVCTRDGRPVRIVCWNRKSGKGLDMPILALALNEDDTEEIIRTDINGYEYSTPTNNCRDIMMAEKYEGWVNLIVGVGCNHITIAPTIYNTKEEANKAYYGGYDIIATTKISWEDKR